jgi:hypothetical protein
MAIPAPSSYADFNMVFLRLVRAHGPGRALPGRTFKPMAASAAQSASSNACGDSRWVQPEASNENWANPPRGAGLVLLILCCTLLSSGA